MNASNILFLLLGVLLGWVGTAVVPSIANRPKPTVDGGGSGTYTVQTPDGEIRVHTHNLTISNRARRFLGMTVLRQDARNLAVWAIDGETQSGLALLPWMVSTTGESELQYVQHLDELRCGDSATVSTLAYYLDGDRAGRWFFPDWSGPIPRLPIPSGNTTYDEPKTIDIRVNGRHVETWRVMRGLRIERSSDTTWRLVHPPPRFRAWTKLKAIWEILTKG